MSKLFNVVLNYKCFVFSPGLEASHNNYGITNHRNPKELGNKYLYLTQPHATLAPTQEFHQAVIKYMP